MACRGHLSLLCFSHKQYSWSCLRKRQIKRYTSFSWFSSVKKVHLHEIVLFFEAVCIPVESDINAWDGSCSTFKFNYTYTCNSYTLLPRVRMHYILVIIYTSIGASKVYCGQMNSTQTQNKYSSHLQSKYSRVHYSLQAWFSILNSSTLLKYLVNQGELNNRVKEI